MVPAPQATGIYGEHIQVFSSDGLDVEDQVPINDLQVRKRKATNLYEVPSTVEDQAILSEGPSAPRGIALVLPTHCYRLDVPVIGEFPTSFPRESPC